MIIIKSPREIELIKKSAQILIEVFDFLEIFIKPGVSTGAINREVERIITKHGAYPTFKGYGGFPYAACVSKNDTLIHGFSSFKDILKSGDIVSVDIGATLNGYVSDACRTYLVGEVAEDVKALVKTTEESFFEAAKLIKPGVHLGDISHAIQKYCEERGYSLPKDYSGHGVGLHLHEDPSIPNFGKSGTGPLLKEGMVLAIEPMVNMGSDKTYVLGDQWTVKTKDGKMCAHYENTLVVTKEGCAILTLKQ